MCERCQVCLTGPNEIEMDGVTMCHICCLTLAEMEVDLLNAKIDNLIEQYENLGHDIQDATMEDG